MVQYTYAQTNCLEEGLTTSVKANFGIDADIKSGILSFNTEGLNEAETDDWFLGPTNGLGVIDTTDIATIADLAARLNITAEFRMSQPINSNINGNLWIDAVYFRDHYSFNNVKDSTIFGSGDNKNYDNPESWTIKTGNVPAKNDIIDVYGHLRRNSDQTNYLWAFGAASTRSQNGDNYIDFEYFRQPVTYTSPSSPGAQGALSTEGSECGHTAYKFDAANGKVLVNGDIILSINYTNGGTVADFRFYAWIDSNEIKGLDENDSSLTDADFKFYNENLMDRPFDFGDGNGGYEFYNCNNDTDIPYGYARIIVCRDVMTDDDDLIYAQDNTSAEVLAPTWGTIGPDGNVNSVYNSLTIIEFALNTTLLGLDGSLSDEICAAPFGTVIVKTRASTAFTSELKDLAGPFNLGDTHESETTLEIECPPMIEVQCREDVPEADVNDVIIINGGEGGEPLVQFVNDVSDNGSCPEIITRTYSATDACGNIVYCSQIITVNDAINPEITDLADYQLEGCNTEWPPNLSTSWTDNCAADGNIVSNGGVAGPDSADGCQQTRIYTFNVTDDCGNSDQETTTLTRDYDITDPMIVDVPNFSLVGCNTPWPTFLATIWTDNCATGGVLNSNSGVAGPDSADGCHQTRIYTFNVTDDCGNSDQETTTLTRDYDITDPMIVDVPNFSLVGCNTPWPPFLATIWTDNCATGGVLNSNSGVAGPDSADGCQQTRIYTFNVTDDCGNSDQETTTLTRDYDITDPMIVDVPNFSLVGCNTPWPTFLATIWTDNCATGGVLNSNGGVANGSSEDGCTQYRLYTFTVTDNCGNRDTETTRIAREYDMTDPMIVDVPNFSLVGCNTPWPTFLATIWTDNCATGGVLNSNSGVAGPDSADGCHQTRIYTFNVTDDCGNSDQETTTLTRDYDITDPMIVDVPNFSLVGCNTPWPPFLATIWTDNCATGGVLNSNSGVAGPDSADGCQQTRIYTFNVTDDCGNSDQETTTLTRDYDITDPMIVDVPNFSLVGCNTPWPTFLATIWTDNCATGGVLNSNGGVAGPDSADGCQQTRIYTFNVTDDCGNTDQETTTLTRDYDFTAPEIANLDDYQLEGCNTEWPPNLSTSWTDNCTAGGDIVSDGGVAGLDSADGCQQTRIYTFNVTDNCGNSDQETTTLTRDYDMTDPEITDLDDYQLEGCNTEWPPNLSTSWTDNCAADGNIVSDGGVAGPDSADGCQQSRIYTFNVTDDCGNSDQETTTLTRDYDMTNPEIVDKDDYSLEGCNTPWPPFLDTIWTDNCSAGGSIDSDGGVDDGSSPDGSMEYRLYTFEIIDDCGNTDIETTVVSREVGGGDKILGDDIQLCRDWGDFDLFSLLTGGATSDGSWSLNSSPEGIDIEISDSGTIFVFEELPFGDYVFHYNQGEECHSLIEEVKVYLLEAEPPCVRCLELSNISTALTPNGDGVNDEFHAGLDPDPDPLLREECGTIDVQIFNRWGAKIFEARDYQNDWQGTVQSNAIGSAGTITTGSYFYIIKYNINGNEETITGYFYAATE